MQRPAPAWVRGGFTPADPDYARRMTTDDGKGRAMELVGVSLDAFGPGWVELSVPFRRELTNESGVMHGGMVGFLADEAGGFAAFSLLPADSSCVTVELKINFLAPVSGGVLKARSQVIRSGRNLSVVEVELLAAEDGRERPAAIVLMTMMHIKGEGAPRA